MATITLWSCNASAKLRSTCPGKGSLCQLVPPAVAGYTGPGDITTMTVWYGLRAYSAATAATTNKLINIKRDSDSHTCDVNSTTGGDIGNTSSCSIGGENGTAVATWCNVTICHVLTLYDLTGGGRDVTCTGSCATSTFPTLIFNCTNSKVCLSMPLTGGGGTQEFFSAANFTPATGILSISAVGNRSAGTTEFLWVQADGGNNRSKATVANNHACLTNAAAINQTASDAAFHALACGLNGNSAGSYNIVDGASVTGTLTANTTAGKIIIAQNNGSSGNVGEFCEGGFADNTLWSSTIYGNLHTNQSAYWGTP